MDQAQNLLSSLESASKKHEESVVIELGTDRLIRWLGVYTILFLGVASKVGDLVIDSVVCHPAGTISDASGEFIAFAATYCWSHSSNNFTNSTCALTRESSTEILNDPNNVKNFVKAIPYIMMVQAFLFSFPLAFWHLRVGARLVGHLKFMQLLLNEIFEKVKTVPKGKYKYKPYDATSSTLDGRKRWHNDVTTNKTSSCLKRVTISCCEGNYKTETLSEETVPMGNVGGSGDGQNSTPPKNSSQPSQDQSEKVDAWIGLLAGNMRDRHFFSILCYENFANLHHLPYILSAFKLTPFVPDKDASKKTYIKAPLHQSMIHLWCDKENLNNTFLLKMYALKQLVTSLLAICMLVALITWFFYSVFDDVKVSETFGCEIPFQTTCLLCAIKRLTDVIVLFSLDLAVTLVVLFLSLWKWFDVRSSDSKETAHFFDNLEETSNVALLAAEYAAM
uniref:Uncharacterized protein LOC100186235 n=1 Tax=Phallusia mammillata TaxID=59560 RepID=A0A6F9DHU7_9ASCI|nr:uncharacterized protein LOC100186235 [Phallusia mammillata]